MKHFLTLNKDWNNEEIIKNSILLFLDKTKHIQEYVNDKINPSNNEIDANFHALLLSFYNYVNQNYHILKIQNILLLLTFLSNF